MNGEFPLEVVLLLSPTFPVPSTLATFLLLKLCCWFLVRPLDVEISWRIDSEASFTGAWAYS